MEWGDDVMNLRWIVFTYLFYLITYSSAQILLPLVQQ